MFWGITPALDLLDEIEIKGPIPDEMNILLIGGTDARHIIKTIANRNKRENSNLKLNFYVMENIPEVIAKQLILLNIAFQPTNELGSVQKTRIFMEIYGNCFLRPTTSKYLTQRGQEFVKVITDYNYMNEIMPYVKLDLKFKERDYLENLYKFWASTEEFDLADSWDKRMRKMLGVRYDTKKGVFDWDLHMRFHVIGGQQVCSQEYESFRKNGIAFTWLECEATKPNRAMVCGVIPNGESYGHFGYLGDMVTGPFVAYGLNCSDKEFLKRTNNMNKFRATDVTERNLRELFHDLENPNEDYVHKKASELTLGCVVSQISNLNVVEKTNSEMVPTKKSVKCISLENVTIHFVSIDHLVRWKNRQEYKEFFHIIYYNNSYLKYLTVDVLKHISALNCVLILENQIFVLSHRDKDLEEYERNIKEKIEGLELVECPFNVKKDYYAKFILQC